MLLVTSNRGLCGAYNAQVLRQALSYFKENSDSDINIVTVGRKGENAIKRLGKNIVASFNGLPDNVNSQDILPISRLLISEFMNTQYDKVVCIYTDFISPLVQKARLKQILPIVSQELDDFIDQVGDKRKRSEKRSEIKNDNPNYLIEGPIDELAGSLAYKIIKMQIFQMILESNAGEQSSRMVAMKNASEASGEMIDDLTLAFNKARQAGITQEISEISAGMASLN